MTQAVRIFIFLSLCVWFPQVLGESIKDQGEPPPLKFGTFNLYFENDLFTGTDQNYTNGVKFSWISKDLTKPFLESKLSPLQHIVVKHLPFVKHYDDFFDTRSQRNFVFSLGQNIFTPEDIAKRELIKDDRPYAGYLYLGAAFQTVSPKRLDTLEFNVGIVGPGSVAEEAQDLVHQARHLQRPKGWKNQIETEPGLNIIYEQRRRVLNYSTEKRFGADSIAHFGGALGNIWTYVNTGLEIRIGWQIPSDFGTSVIRAGGDSTSPVSRWDPRLEGNSQFGIHCFSSVSGRAIFQDIFLDGNTFRDSHSVKKEQLVGEASYGISVIFYGAKLTFAQVLRTKEFKLQKDSHSFGSISLSYAF